MKEGDRGMVFDWEKSVRHGHKDASTNAQQFRNEEALVFEAADVLKNRVRRNDVE